MRDLSARAVPVVSALPTASSDLAGVTLRLASDSKPYWCDGTVWIDLTASGSAGGNAGSTNLYAVLNLGGL